jgi:hypothetical protein
MFADLETFEVLILLVFALLYSSPISVCSQKTIFMKKLDRCGFFGQLQVISFIFFE